MGPEPRVPLGLRWQHARERAAFLDVFTRIQRHAIVSPGRHPNLKKRASIDAYGDQCRSNSFDSLN